MSIELTKEDRAQAVASIERYFRENMEEKIGNVAASGLLGFLLEEIGPCIYNAYSTGFCHPFQRDSATCSMSILPGQPERSDARVSG